MAVVDKPTLKSYFNDGDLPVESNYVDLIDTMGDMSISVYDTNDDGTVNDSDELGGVVAANYLQRTSASRPGVIKLYRADVDNGYYVRHYWTGTHWYLQGYNSSDVFHAGCRVEYANVAPWAGITGKPSTYTPSAHTHPGSDITSAVDDSDKLDGYHYSSFVRSDANDTKTGYLASSGGIAVGSNTVAPTAGQIWFNDANCRVYDNGSNLIRHYNSYGYCDIGANASSQCVFETGENIFLFNKAVYSTNSIVSGTTGIYASYAGSTSNALVMQKHADDAHIFINGESTVALRVNYSGGTIKTVHFHNGSSSYGDIHADNFVNESTLKSKSNVRPLRDTLYEDALDVIFKMNPIAFEKRNTGPFRRTGLAAEDMIHIFPDVVATDPETNDPVGIDYGQMVPLLILAIQELQERLNVRL